LRLIAALLLVLLAGPAAAQTIRFAPDPPEEQVTRLMANARSDLSRVTGSAGVPNESLLQRGEELLSITDARAVIDVGFASGAARWCGLDWQSNLRNLLAEERARPGRNERQVAYVGVLHAHAMAASLDAFTGRRCAPSDRAMLTEYMRQRWRAQ
jgi:hypothetical protein